jgi:hypothetical protein
MAFESIARTGQLVADLSYTGDRVYEVHDAVSEADAITQALTALSTDLGGTVLNNSPLSTVKVTETAVADFYMVTFSFEPFERKTPQQVADASRLEFNFSMESETFFTSINTTAYGAEPADFDNAIGVKLSSSGTLEVNGAQAPSNGFSFSRRIVVPMSSMNDTYVQNIASCWKKTNNATFKGFPEGTILFASASGAQRGQEDFELNFTFMHRQHRTGISVGSIDNVDVDAWEILDPFTLENEDPDFSVWGLVVDAVYVHQVYESANFALLGTL